MASVNSWQFPARGLAWVRISTSHPPSSVDPPPGVFLGLLPNFDDLRVRS